MLLKKFRLFFLVGLTTILFSFTSDAGYDPSLVEITSTTYNTDKFIMVSMKREGNHIKAKYFAATDPKTNKTIQQRFKSWSVGKKIICFSSGTYMNSCYQNDLPTPVGLCIDNGYIVNETLDKNFGGLVVVYATGGMVATKLSDGNLSIQSGSNNTVLDIKNNTFDRVKFKNWAVENDGTVFQSHLLVYKDKLDINYCYTGTCMNKDPRRFLAVCKDQNDKIIHVIVHCMTKTTLYEGSRKAYTFLKEFKDMKEIVFMVNLDTGCQNVFTLYQPNGSQRLIKIIDGYDFVPIEQAVNLLVYYYE